MRMPAWGSLGALLAGRDTEIERLLRGGEEVGFWDPVPGAEAPLPGPHAARAIAQAAQEASFKVEGLLAGDRLGTDLAANLRLIRSGAEVLGRGATVVVRHLRLGAGGAPAAVLFGQGLADKDYVQRAVLAPLMHPRPDVAGPHDLSGLRRGLLPANNVVHTARLTQIVQGLFQGKTAVLLGGEAAALLVNSKKFPSRKVTHARNEPIVRGPQEAFVEDMGTNVALVRKGLETRHLVEERVKAGHGAGGGVTVLYLANLAAPDLVQEVHRRLTVLRNVDVLTSGIVEQLIEDAPNSPYPQTLATERPDRVIGFLVEGHVALLVEGDPWALVVPTSFWAMLHTSEDTYLRWPYSAFSRTMRGMAVAVTLLMPAFYVAAVNYHPEMIPTELLLAIAAAREHVPFPTIVEALVMALGFELIREAGLRIPSVIGPTIGIVGALILGQAAVQANLVSPAMVIVIALTGLASFAVPNYSLSNALRITTWAYMGVAGIFGFVGMASMLFVQLVGMSALKSFGRPYLAPATPWRGRSRDILFTFPYWQQEARPFSAGSQKIRRQPHVLRRWQQGAGGAGSTGGRDPAGAAGFTLPVSPAPPAAGGARQGDGGAPEPPGGGGPGGGPGGGAAEGGGQA